MSYNPNVSTTKVGDIFTDEFITKINEVLKDLSDIANSKDKIHITARINVIDRYSNIGFFIFEFDSRYTASQSALRQLRYYSFSEYINDSTQAKINVKQNFQITADTIFV